MQALDLPGQVIHIRMEGATIAVSFANVPWLFHLSDVLGAVDAFNRNDWQFFQECWWDAHPHLRAPSAVLNQLALMIDPRQLYSASTLLEWAVSSGLFQAHDPIEVHWDFQRLALLPRIQHWPTEGFTSGAQKGGASAACWPGYLWASAIVEVSDMLRMEDPIPSQLVLGACA